MKKIIFLLVFLALGQMNAAAAAADYNSVAAELSQAMARFQASHHEAGKLDALLHRDPMVSLVDAGGNVINPAGLQKGVIVQGVIWSKNDKAVLIDDLFYREGDTVGPYKILEIRSKGFLARKDGATVFVPLYVDDEANNNSQTVYSQTTRP